MNLAPGALLRFSIWIAMIVSLVFIMLHTGNKLHLKSIDTAYTVAANRMLAKANYYKENWIIRGRPQGMLVDGEMIEFTEQGWPLPLQKNRLDCRYWLELLNEHDEVFGSPVNGIDGRVKENGYICSYSYTERNVIVIKLIDKTLSVGVEL